MFFNRTKEKVCIEIESAFRRISIFRHQHGRHGIVPKRNPCLWPGSAYQKDPFIILSLTEVKLLVLCISKCRFSGKCFQLGRGREGGTFPPALYFTFPFRTNCFLPRFSFVFHCSLQRPFGRLLPCDSCQELGQTVVVVTRALLPMGI